MPKKLWFKRKTYGYGWVPCTWQGWLFLLVATLLFVPLVTRFEDLPRPLFFLLVILWTLALLLVTYLKGPSPRWQWGPAPDDKEE